MIPHSPFPLYIGVGEGNKVPRPTRDGSTPAPEGAWVPLVPQTRCAEPDRVQTDVRFVLRTEANGRTRFG